MVRVIGVKLVSVVSTNILPHFIDTFCCLELVERWAVMKMVLIIIMTGRKSGETGLLVRRKARNTGLLV